MGIEAARAAYHSLVKQYVGLGTTSVLTSLAFLYQVFTIPSQIRELKQLCDEEISHQIKKKKIQALPA
jgi:hypothetical protein